MQGFPNSVKRWWGEGGLEILLGGGGLLGGDLHKEFFSRSFEAFCDAQINISYILNIS